LKPVIENDKAIYTYIVPNYDDVEWLQLLYNNDPILRYKLNVKKL
jgi:hypothetical protein